MGEGDNCGDPWSPPRQRPRMRGVLDGVAAVCAAPAALALVADARPGIDTAVAAIYGLALVLMLTWSAAYHTPRWSPLVYAWMRKVDHANIYLLIAASYTPFVMPLAPRLRAPVLALVWISALAGVILSVLWTRRTRGLSALLYVVLGLSLLPIAPQILAGVGPRAFTLLLTGGALYIVGAAIYARRWPDPAPRVFGYHELFHLFVFAAAACHHVAIRGLLVG